MANVGRAVPFRMGPLEFYKLRVWDVAADEEQNRNIVTIIQVFAYGFIVLISLLPPTDFSSQKIQLFVVIET